MVSVPIHWHTDAPRSLGCPRARNLRLNLIEQPHVRDLNEWARKHGFRYFDPLAGAICAQCLLLLESPGPEGPRNSGFISQDNDDRGGHTARNLFEASKTSRLPREKTVLWNVVPWHLENRRPNTDDITKALPLLSELLASLTNLRVVVLLGKYDENDQLVKGYICRRAGKMRRRVRVIPSRHPQWAHSKRAIRSRLLKDLEQARGILT
jgi:hypothetical protein